MKFKKMNKSSNKLTKKSFLLGTIASVLCSVPLTVGVAEIAKNMKTYSLNNKQFSSLDSAVSYAKENSKKETYTLENEGSKWEVILNNGEIKTFNSPKEMRETLLNDSKITEEIYTSNIDVNNYVDKISGELNIPDSADFVKGQLTDSSKTIYKGNESQIYTDETAAKESLFKTSEAYNFDNLYFKNKSDLRDYLEKEFINKKENIEMNSIVLKGPNGVKSNAINLKSKNAISEINSFIENNTQKVINYVNSETKESVNITKNNVSKVLSSINTKDLELQHVQSNEGESRYVIDNRIDDDYDLLGPYFYKGNLDIGAFMNKNMWKKVNGVTNQVYQESEVDKIIGSFFSSIINDDNAANIQEANEESKSAYLFRTPLKVGEKNIDEWFFEMIGNFNSDLKSSIVRVNIDLMQGKKYNTFNKLPILYTFILQRLFSLKAPQTVMDQTISYFKQIGNFIQKSIETIVLDPVLLEGKSGQPSFDVNTFFHIGNPEFDTNTSTQYFINNLKTNYPTLVGAMSSYLGGVNNIYTTGGQIPYEGYNQWYLMDFGILDRNALESNATKYKNIYDTFSSTDFNKLVVNFVKFSKNPEVSALNGKTPEEIISGLDKISTSSDLTLKEYLHGIGTKNTMIYHLATAAIKDEIEKYNNNNGYIEPNGYLDKLNQYGKAGYFVEWANDTPQYEIYQVYLAILIDAKQGSYTNIFNDRDSIVNNFRLGMNLTRLISYTLAYGFLTSGIITKLYFAYDSSSLAYTLKNKVSSAWTSIKNKLPSTMRTWRINASTRFNVQKWSLYNVFTKVQKGLNLINAAAPIFGSAFLAFEVFTLVYQLLKVETTTNFYVYTAPDGTEFIWNGGRTVSRFFGFDVKETSGINNMKLVNPIEITLPQLEEYYYFDGIKYYDPSQGKKAYLNYLLNNNNVLVNKNFSFKHIFANDMNDENAKTFDNIDSLKEDVFKSLNIDRKSNTIDSSKVNLKSEYISEIGYKFGNIGSFDPSTLEDIQKQKFVNDIVDNIRETLFIKLPQYSTNDDYYNPINIPGKVWINGSIAEDNSKESSKYLISNKANEVDKNGNYLLDKNQALIASKDELKEKFMTSATVQSKIVFATNNFSSIFSKTFDQVNSDNLKSQKVYTVFKPGLGTKKFIDKSKAEKYAMNYKSINKLYSTYKEVAYIYNGMYFANENLLKSWIEKNGNY